MDGKRSSLQSTEVTLTAAPVQRSIAIQNFIPRAMLGNSNPIVGSNHRSEIADEQQLVIRILTATQEADHAPLKIAAVNPGESAGLEISLVKCGLATIGGVQIAYPALQPGVQRCLEEMPFETAVVIPLRPLPELPTHE